MSFLTDYDFAFGGGQDQQMGGRRYKSGPGAKKAIPKKPRLKLRVVDGALKYVPKKLRKRSGRNIFISEYAKKNKVSGPTLMKKGNAAWNALSKAQKDTYEARADAMGYKPAAKPRSVAQRFARKNSPKAGASPRRRSPKRKSKSPKRKSKSPKRRSKSPKRRSKSPKRRSKSPKRKSPKRRKSPRRKQRGGKCGSTHDETYQYGAGNGENYEDMEAEEDPLNNVENLMGGDFMF